jgi:hypothetical protein
MRYQPPRYALGAIGLALVLTAGAPCMSWAQQQETVRVRGTVEKVEGSTMIVKSRDGATLTVKLTDNLRVLGLSKISIADIKPGSYVGVSSIPQADASRRALHVHLFLETMRGTAEGHRPFDLMPQSTMTNATVAETVTRVEGTTMILKYKDGEQKIIVPPDAPIVAYAAGDKSELKPGAKIIIVSAAKQPDGTLAAASVTVGRDGLTPPM